jgi:CHAT domain-containing protein
LRDKLSKARSLREAILEVKAAYPHPYYWAPFVLLGKS